MSEQELKYYSAGPGEVVHGFGFGNVATGQVVNKKIEFLQRASSVGRGDSRDSLNPDIRLIIVSSIRSPNLTLSSLRSPTPSQMMRTVSPRVTSSESRAMMPAGAAGGWSQQSTFSSSSSTQQQVRKKSYTFLP